MLPLLAVDSLPSYCTPTSPFLEAVSSFTHACIPTHLALVSSLLGCLSIFSWLFAQLPQIVRNYQDQSTAGLSLFFLVEWNLGDLCNLFGALLTKQAAWQIIIGAYYVFVDVSLVCQWVWYEWLKHGRPLRRVNLVREGDQDQHANGTTVRVRASDQRKTRSMSPGSIPQDIPSAKSSYAHNMFSTPIYGTISPSASLSASPANRTIHRIQRQSLPSGSPRAVMFLTVMLAIAISRAAPLGATSAMTSNSNHYVDLGTTLSWTSTVLYLVSRLPQLVLNYRRKSTAGLSPKMFAAAFLGNLFYSASLALNPNAWYSFSPYGGNGWASSEGNDRREWILAALPFFLGAAGVLGLDGAVGFQFWLYGEGRDGQGNTVVLIHERSRAPGAREKSVSLKKVTGWMRGWQPSASGRVTPVVNVKIYGDDEAQPLLSGQSSGSPSASSHTRDERNPE